MASTIPGRSPVPLYPSRDALRANCARLGIPMPKIAMVACIRTPSGPGTLPAHHGQVASQQLTIDSSISVVIGDFGRPVVRLTNDVTNLNRCYFPGVPAFTKNITVLAVVVNQRQSAGTNVCCVGKWNTGGTPGSNDWMLGMNFSSTSTDYRPSWSVEIGSTATGIADTNSWAVGERLVLCGVRAETSMKLYRGGAEVASGTCGTGDINNNMANIQFGQITAGAGFNSQTDYELVCIWDSALPPKVIAFISADPMMLWVEDEEPASPLSFFRAPQFLGNVIEPVMRLPVSKRILQRGRSWFGQRRLRLPIADGGIETARQISGCVLNLDVTRVTPQADNTSLNAVQDFSSNGWNFTSVFGTAPKYRTGGVNGQPYARFDGSGFLYDGLNNTNAGLNLNAGYTIAAVVRNVNASSVFGKNTTAPADSTRRKLQVTSLGHSAGADGKTFSVVAPRPGVGDTYIVVVVVIDDTHVEIRLNGVSMGTISAFSNTNIATQVADNNTAPGCFGAAFSTTTAEALIGDLYEVVIYNNPLAAANVLLLEQLYSRKYAIPLLGYKSTSWAINLELMPQVTHITHCTFVELGNDGVAAAGAVTTLYSLAGSAGWNSSGGNRPVIRAAAGGLSRQYLDPDGSDDFMTSSGGSEFSASAYTMFMCARYGGSGGTQIISKGDTGTGGAGRRNTHYFSGNHVRGGDSGTSVAPSTAVANNTWFVSGLGVTNATTVKYRRGVTSIENQEAPTPGASFAPTGTNAQAATMFCTFPGGVEGGGACDFAGAMLFNVVLSDADLVTWLQAIGSHFGLAPWGIDPTVQIGPPRTTYSGSSGPIRRAGARVVNRMRNLISKPFRPSASPSAGGADKRHIPRGLNRGLNRG